MEDCVINCGGPIEEPEDTTLGLEAAGGTEAVVAAALTSSVLTELPEETTSGLAEQQDQLMTTLPTQQHGNSSKSLPAATAATTVRPTEAPGIGAILMDFFLSLRYFLHLMWQHRTIK